MAIDIIYLRRYLDDPVNVDPTATPQASAEIDPPDPNINYYRRYLVDPLNVSS